MTWLKLSDDFSRDMAFHRVSDAAFRTHVEALNRCMFRLNEGVIQVNELNRFLESPLWSQSVDELIDKGLWSMNEDDDSFTVHHAMEYQRTPDQVAKEREGNKERQRRRREGRTQDE